MVETSKKDLNIRKYALLTIVASLLISAVLGTLTFVFGSFGSLEFKILATVLSLGFFCLLGLSTAIWYETDKQIIFFFGGIMSLLGFILTQKILWDVPFLSQSPLIKILITNNILLVGLGIASILLTIKSSNKLVKYFKSISLALLFLTAVGLSLMTVFEFTERIAVRLIGSTAVLGTAATISTFILDKIRE